MPELHVFDFDGTLFRSPMPPAWWSQKKDWWTFSESLGRPCVPDKPDDSWWVGRTVQQAKRSISNPDVWAILCTGRSERSFARWRVPELLRQKGLNFDEVRLSPQTGILGQFKQDIVRAILGRLPQVTTVHVWDDTPDILGTLKRAVLGMGRECFTYQVRVTVLQNLSFYPKEEQGVWFLLRRK